MFILKFEEYFPTHLAYKWDNVGLQIGDENSAISGLKLSASTIEPTHPSALSGRLAPSPWLRVRISASGRSFRASLKCRPPALPSPTTSTRLINIGIPALFDT